jgi:hypothetical protein
MKKQKYQAGLGVVEVIIVLVILALIGVGGWYVWSANQKSQSLVTNSNTTAGNVPVDPYAGWKLYCDTTQKVCFKYPADWSMEPRNNGDIVGAIIQNPNGSIVVSYLASDTRDGSTMPYYTATLEDLSTANAAFKVVGGYTPSTGDIVPRYKVVDTKFVIGLTAGQQTNMVNTARFTNKDGSTGHLEVYPTQTSGFDATKAKAWFTFDDAKTAELIVKSFYLQ